MRSMLTLLIAFAVLAGTAPAALAVDQSIDGTKLVIKRSGSGKEKFVFVSKDAGFLFPTIGGADDPANGSPGGALIEILSRDEADASFSIPAGESLPPGWKVKDATIDLYKYVNKDAPTGPTPVKVMVLKDGKVLKIVSKSTGLALTGSQGAVVIRITTGSLRNCTLFDAPTIKKDEADKFIAKNSLASSLTDCSMGPPTTTTSTTTSTSSSTSSSSTTTTSTSTTSTSSTSTSSTSSTSTSSTSTSSSSTTSTSTSSTTSTTIFPGGTRFNFTTGLAGGICGEARAGGAAGAILKNLTCGGLNIGGGAATVPEGPTPAGALTRFSLTGCNGLVSSCTVGPTPNNGSNDCSDVGCPFGPPLSIANGGLSTCVLNSFSAPAAGSLDTSTGAFSGAVPLSSAVTVTGNVAEPCPPCSGTPGAGVCNAAAANPGAACTGLNAAGDSYECQPNGTALAPFGVNLSPLSTGTESATGPSFCPSQATPGCFSQGTCDYYEERGVPAGPLTPGAKSITLASAFCIPLAGNVLIDGAADLPGPGAISLPGTGELLP
jgi:uncharacterized membrane protein